MLLLYANLGYFDSRIVVENETNNSIAEVTSTFVKTDDGDTTNSFDHDKETEEEEDQDILKFEQ